MVQKTVPDDRSATLKLCLPSSVAATTERSRFQCQHAVCSGRLSLLLSTGRQLVVTTAPKMQDMKMHDMESVPCERLYYQVSKDSPAFYVLLFIHPPPPKKMMVRHFHVLHFQSTSSLSSHQLWLDGAVECLCTLRRGSVLSVTPRLRNASINRFDNWSYRVYAASARVRHHTETK